MIGTYNADPVHSSLGFSIPYQGVSVFRGTLTEVDAKLVDGRLEGTAPVESISITTPETFRAHVLSAEFFDVKAHPEVTFVSTALDVQEDGRARVSGDLTIKGVTKPVHATGTWTAPATDAFGNTRRTSLSRRSSTARSGASTGTRRCPPAATRSETR
jgi:polyisoprenoid-binding protein YceI